MYLSNLTSVNLSLEQIALQTKEKSCNVSRNIADSQTLRCVPTTLHYGYQQGMSSRLPGPDLYSIVPVALVLFITIYCSQSLELSMQYCTTGTQHFKSLSIKVLPNSRHHIEPLKSSIPPSVYLIYFHFVASDPNSLNSFFYAFLI